MSNEIVAAMHCRELISKARAWFRQRAHNMELAALKAELVATQQAVSDWRVAWHDQRIATGKAYWDGYRSGKGIAIAWHSMEADRRKNAANAFTRPEDKASMEFDVRYHEYSAEKIAECGVMVSVDGKVGGVDK